jgi:hypothetical protein
MIKVFIRLKKEGRKVRVVPENECNQSKWTCFSRECIDRTENPSIDDTICG